MREKDRSKLEVGIEHLINLHSLEHYSNTPDFILAKYLRRCLEAFNETLQERDKWYGVDKGVSK